MPDSTASGTRFQGIRLPSDAGASFHERLLDSLHDGVYFVDVERKILYWNKGAELLTGYTAEEAVGQHCFDNFLEHVNAEGCLLCLHGCPLATTIADGQRREHDVYFRHKLGHRVPVSVRVAPLVNGNGAIIGAVEVFTDITARKNIERRVGELENLAFLDALTGVPNRRYTELKVKQVIQDVEQFDRRAGLLMIDVDEFKKVNDKYGHEVGDDALKSISRTLKSSLRLGDILGRWGGEEFLLIVRDVTPKSLKAFAERCRMLIEESAIPVSDGQIRITASFGGTLVQRCDTELTSIKRADDAMYQSKSSGRNRVTLA